MLARLATSEVALVLLSALLHALWSASIKGSRSPLAFNVLQLVPTTIAAVALPALVPLGEISRPVWLLVAATGVAHGFYFYWLTRALEGGELFVVYPIARSAPALLPLLAVPLLGEQLSVSGALGIGVVVAGMWAVQVDPGAGFSLARLAAPGTGFAWLTLAASVGYSLCDKAAMARIARSTTGAPRCRRRSLLRAAECLGQPALRTARAASPRARRARRRGARRVA